MRHGQAISNVKDLCSCWPEKFKNPLTLAGKKQATETAKKLKTKNIDLIFASPLLRTKQTAEIVAKVLGIKPKLDIRLKEQDVGVFNGLPFPELKIFFGEKGVRRFKLKPEKGETYIDIEKRMLDFLKDIDKKYSNPPSLKALKRRINILIVSHELPLLFLDCAVKGIKKKDFYKKRERISMAQLRALN